MVNFRRCLTLWKAGRIEREEALIAADSRTNLEWRMNFGGEEIIHAQNVETRAQAEEDDVPLLPPV